MGRIQIPVAFILIALALQSPACAQQPIPDTPASVPADPKPGQPAQGSPSSQAIGSPNSSVKSASSAPQQTKRILKIIPNYRSVSANTYLPPQRFKEKFWLATQETFDYSGFIYVGIVTGITMSQNSEPSFGEGASGFGQYYGHNFADYGIENYLVEAVVPTLTKEDPRYYTLGHGGFLKRTGYALSRAVVTRKDSGGPTVNISEIVGAGAAAGISNAYYPPQSDPWVKTYQRWISAVAQDGISNILKEFWPDINHAIFHGKY
jgi:hypothetical protein